MVNYLIIILLALNLYGAIDIYKGIFVESHETDFSTGAHDLKKREFSIANQPDIANLKDGWNYNKIDRVKEGLQIYISKKYVSVEFYKNGEKLSTAVYRDGKPDGWFYKYKKGKKDGLQHYFSGNYQSIELYKNGEKLETYVYRDGKPDGWFYKYKKKKKHGVQKYVSGNYWSIETYENGEKHGLTGSYRNNKKDGWHYHYIDGKQTEKVYYSY